KGVSIAQLALAWLLHQPVVTSVIIGANKMEQLEDNLNSVNVSFSVDELKKLDEVSKLPTEYPGWMLEFTGYDRQLQWPAERKMPE
ncbi:MAG TPA: aldo/keto reductase, partial [Puia sp.]|nr:aldo/keto reductase [Puia sp.]